MPLYWANAITEDGEKLFTCDGCLTCSEAMSQFSIWRDHYGYRLKEMWIQEYENGKETGRYEVRNIWTTSDTE